MTNENWLIQALRIGYERGDVGISFNELNVELTKLGRRPLTQSELYSMRYWFHSTFITSWFGLMNGAPDRGSDMNLMHTNSNDERGILGPKGVMDYLAHLNYQQALISSRSAKLIAAAAIIVTTVLGAIQIGIAACD